MYFATILGKLPEQTDYADYRVVAGTKVPFHEELLHAWGTEVRTWKEVQTNVPLDEKVFQKPEAPAPKS